VSSNNFKFNEREFQRMIEKTAHEKVPDLVRPAQAALDRVYRQHKGQPVEAVIAPLRSALRGANVKADATELRNWAQTISNGNRIVIKPELRFT
jgi:hypothetical protein